MAASLTSLLGQAQPGLLIPAFVPTAATPPETSTPPLAFSTVTVAPLWTVDDVKAIQLRIRDTLHDADVAEKLETAQEAVIAYLAVAADPAWTAATAPKRVKHAILLLTTHYYEHRGDDLTESAAADTGVWKEIAQLLGMHRDPTLA